MGETVWANQTSAFIEDDTPRQMDANPVALCIAETTTTATTTAYTIVNPYHRMWTVKPACNWEYALKTNCLHIEAHHTVKTSCEPCNDKHDT